ncbi:MAG: hypothetical protein IJZ68_08745 [Bacteroidaceae bacterium]|nr:hypothetical protein [Bacteroidaceae bacterium]
MTYRKKAEQLLMERLGVNEFSAPDIVRLLEREGEYIPAVFGVLNVSSEIEDWDAEIPESEA